MSQIYHRGEAHPQAKLTEQAAREVFALAHGGVLSQREIGERYGIAKATVQTVKERRTWGWLWNEEQRDGTT